MVRVISAKVSTQFPVSHEKAYKRGYPRCYQSRCQDGKCIDPIPGIKCHFRERTGAKIEHPKVDNIERLSQKEIGKFPTYYRGKEITLKEYFNMTKDKAPVLPAISERCQYLILKQEVSAAKSLPAYAYPLAQFIEMLPTTCKVSIITSPEHPTLFCQFKAKEIKQCPGQATCFHDAVYEIILTLDKGQGVPLAQIQQESRLTGDSVKSILTQLEKEFAIGQKQPEIYEPI